MKKKSILSFAACLGLAISSIVPVFADGVLGPIEEIDHINGLDNCIKIFENLEGATLKYGKTDFVPTATYPGHIEDVSIEHVLNYLLLSDSHCSAEANKLLFVPDTEFTGDFGITRGADGKFYLGIGLSTPTYGFQYNHPNSISAELVEDHSNDDYAIDFATAFDSTSAIIIGDDALASASGYGFSPANQKPFQDVVAKYSRASISSGSAGMSVTFPNGYKEINIPVEYYIDNVTYGYLPTHLYFANSFFVPESASSDEEVIATLKDKIAAYSNPNDFYSSRTVELVTDVPDWAVAGEVVPYADIVEKQFGIKDAKYSGKVFKITADWGLEVEFASIVVSDEEYANYLAGRGNTIAIDPLSGVAINSTDAAVTTDSILLTEDKTEDATVAASISEDETLISAYDFTIFNPVKKSKVTTFYDGLTVRVPIDASLASSEDIAARFVGATTEEDIPATVVTEDGKYYAEFEVSHFSTYALLSSIKTTAPVTPPTAEPAEPESPKSPATGIAPVEDIASVADTGLAAFFAIAILGLAVCGIIKICLSRG